MKKYFLIAAILIILFASCLSGSAQDEANAVYMETYMCGDAYTFKIGAQPQMMSQIVVTVLDYDQVQPYPNPVYSESPFIVELGKQTEEDVILLFRVYLRNLNKDTVHGLSPESFILTGKVRDRKITYTPEIFLPYDYYDWVFYTIYGGKWKATRANTNARIIHYPSYLEKPFYKASQIMDEQYMKSKDIESMREQEMMLIYRVPSWLSGWDLHIKPQPMIPDPQLKSCDMILHLPTISNEITKETYKYIDSSK